jgi:23S rRNA (adenine2503-C2)-methyltransferase
MTAHFFNLDKPALEKLVESAGFPRYRAAQVLDWVYRHGVVDPARMTNLPPAMRSWLEREVVFYRGELIASQLATDETQKLLIGWPDLAVTAPAERSVSLALAEGENDRNQRATECVMIPTEQRRTACLSSQVGCPVGCAFCASGLGGLEGNLTAGQILEQLYRLAWIDGSGRVTNVVFMGMGEPLANFTAVTSAIRMMHAPEGFGLSARRITISTVGLPGAIRKLVQFELPVKLALSLHAPNDALRRKLIPWADYATIEELLQACEEYFHKTGREITLEYILLRRVNDQLDHARELAEVAGRIRANVNLIRYNEVKGLPFQRPATTDVRAFHDHLRKKRINVHIRASRGRDIAAACGQLRHERRASSA